VGRLEEKRPSGRPRRRMEDIIKMDLKEKWSGIDWIHLVQDRDYRRALVNMEMNV
jgi:hypothetical protein